MQFLTSLFSGPNGDMSSKRMLAFMLIISGIVYSFLKKDVTMCGLLIGSGSALLGISAFTKS